MISFYPSHPLRLLCLSAIAGIVVLSLLLFNIVTWWNMELAEEKTPMEVHTDAVWERERLQTIEKTPRPVVQPRAPDASPPGADATLVRTLNTLRRRIEEQYDVEIIMFDTGFLKEDGIDAHPYPLASLQEHLRNLNDWIRMYPPGYIKQSGLKTIALFKGWEQDGIQTTGFLLDRSSIGIEASQSVFHHELFHLSDMSDGGMENDNTDWLHSKYGDKIPKQPSFDALQAIAKKLHEGERPPGFVSAYGKYGGVDEDQATVAEYLLSYPEQVSKWAKKDSALLKSIHEMKEFFYTHSDGLMDDAFWKDQQGGSLFDKDYWSVHQGSKSTASPEMAKKLETVRKLEEARALVSKGKTADAESLFLKLIAAKPEHTSIVSELGLLYEEKKQYAKALDLYQRYLSSTNDPYFDLKMARNLKSLDKVEDAIAHYTNAHRQGYLIDVEREDFAVLYEQYAANLAHNGKSKEAESAYRLMLRLFGERKEWRDAIEKL